MHHYSFCCVNGNIICNGPLLEFVDAVLELAEVWVGGVNINCNSRVVNILPAEVCVSQGVIYQYQETQRPHFGSLWNPTCEGLGGGGGRPETNSLLPFTQEIRQPLHKGRPHA